MRSQKTRKWHSALSVDIGLGLMLVGAVAWAQQTQQQPQATSAPTRVHQTTQQAPSPAQVAPVPAQRQQPAGQESPSPQAAGEAELLHVLVGQSLQVSSPAPIKYISVSSPGIIDAAIQDSNHIQISGKAAGGVSLVVLNETGESQIFYVYVDLDASVQAGQSPEAPPDNPAPAQVQKRTSTAWLGWVVLASVLLLAGAVLVMRRRRQPGSYRFDLQAAKMAPNDDRAEPAPALTRVARDEKPPTEETVTAAVTRPEEHSEKINRELKQQWARQFQEQAEAGAEILRGQLRELKQVVEESKQQLASLAEAKVASLTQAFRDEYGQQLAQSIRERAQMMQEAADAGVKSIRQAAEQAIAQLQAAEQKQEASFQQLAQAFRAETHGMHEAVDSGVKSIKQATEEAIAQSQTAAQNKEAGILACASAAEERLTVASSALEALQGRVAELANYLQSESPKRAEDFEKAAQELGERWSQQFRQQAQEALEQLREEVKNSGRVAEESEQRLAGVAEARLASLDLAAANAVAGIEAAAAKLRDEVSNSGRALAESREQLASLAEAKIALLSQVASTALSNVEAEQGRFRSPYGTSRREPEDVFPRRWANAHPSLDDHGSLLRQRGVVAMLSLAAGLFLVVAVTPWGKFFSTPPPPVQMRLQAEAPSDFADQSPYWSAKRRAKEEETAQAYWRAAASSLQMRYPYGSELPADPAPEFQIDSQFAPAGGAGAVTESRARYWEKLRAYWGQRRFWIESQPEPEPETWSVRLRRLWEKM